MQGKIPTSSKDYLKSQEAQMIMDTPDLEKWQPIQDDRDTFESNGFAAS